MQPQLSAVVPFDGVAPEGALAVVPHAGGGLKPQPASPKAQVVAPSAAWDERNDAVAWAQPEAAKEVPWYRRLESTLLVMLALLDNVLCYVTYATVRAFHGRLYNIVDMHLVLLPGLDVALVGFAALGTASFGLLIVLVECNKLPLFHEIMNFRLYFSALPSSVICFILVYHTEQTQWAPFTTLMAILFFVIAWCLHMRVRYSHQLNVMSKIALDVSWLVALVVGFILVILFATNSLKVVTQSDDLGCPFADNAQMPVRVSVVDKWYCMKWDSSQRTEVLRTPANSVPVQLSCSDTFVSAFGASIEPHKATCPSGCLRAYAGAEVIGCGTYAADSPVCVAAIHSGVLSDHGGEVTVYGRVGVPTFRRCSRFSIVSAERYVTQANTAVSFTPPSTGSSTFMLPQAGGSRRLVVTAPYVQDSNGVQIPQGFHFNNMDETREFIWLKRFDEVSSRDPGIEDGKPWTRVKATVSARIAGIELEDETVRLGDPGIQQLFLQPRSGQVFDKAPTQCRIHERGVLCRGSGQSMVQLDFCRPQAKTCPDG